MVLGRWMVRSGQGLRGVVGPNAPMVLGQNSLSSCSLHTSRMFWKPSTLICTVRTPVVTNRTSTLSVCHITTTALQHCIYIHSTGGKSTMPAVSLQTCLVPSTLSVCDTTTTALQHCIYLHSTGGKSTMPAASFCRHAWCPVFTKNR